MAQRENRYSLIKKSLNNLSGYNTVFDQKQDSIEFENISYYFKNTRNVAFATDTYILYTEYENQPMAVKIIKLSEDELKNGGNTADINHLGTKPIIKPKSTGYNVWREVYCLDKLSPHSSGCPNFPYFYGYFVTKWPDAMIPDYFLHERENDKKYKEYLASRESSGYCIVLMMEFFDYNAIEWTNRQHTLDEWKSVYSQMLKSIDDMHQFDIVHNDSHSKNFILKKEGSDWLVALCDFGSAISTNFDISAKEKILYDKIKKSNRDVKLMFYTFNERDIGFYHLMRLKRMQTIDYLKKEYKDVIDHVKKECNLDINHTICWLKIAETMSYNLDHFSHLIDKNKLPPPEISDLVDNIRQLIQKNSSVKIHKIIQMFE